jgi:hypothetical protein
MRVASFRVSGKDGKTADVGVVPLPGMAGSDLDNVNRWRGQVGQPPVAEAELAKLAVPVQIAGEPAQLYEQSGANADSGNKSRILAAILRRAGSAWFFKMTGDDELVAQQKPAFIEFLKSYSFSEAPASASASAQPELPPSHPPVPGLSSPPSSPTLSPQTPANDPSNSAKPEWQVPAGWKEMPGNQFLVAKFQLTGPDNAQAAVNVSLSGGGLLANVNRWREQLSLSPLADSDLKQQVQALDVAGGQAMLVDMKGTDAKTKQKARVLGVMVPQGEQAWFYKLMGDEPVVEREKDAFTKFVQTVKYH